MNLSIFTVLLFKRNCEFILQYLLVQYKILFLRRYCNAMLSMINTNEFFKIIYTVVYVAMSFSRKVTLIRYDESRVPVLVNFQSYSQNIQDVATCWSVSHEGSFHENVLSYGNRSIPTL